MSRRCRQFQAAPWCGGSVPFAAGCCTYCAGRPKAPCFDLESMSAIMHAAVEERRQSHSSWMAEGAYAQHGPLASYANHRRRILPSQRNITVDLPAHPHTFHGNREDILGRRRRPQLLHQDDYRTTISGADARTSSRIMDNHYHLPRPPAIGYRPPAHQSARPICQSADTLLSLSASICAHPSAMLVEK